MKKVLVLFTLFVLNFTLNAQDLKLGDSIPSFELNRGSEKVISSELKGKVVLVSLFATWCGPCQLELAEIEKTLWPKYKDNDKFKLIVLGREHTAEELKTYNDRKKFTFPLYPDPKREVYAKFAEKTIPRAYLFDAEGKLIYTSIGFEKEEFSKMMDEIENQLNKQ